uniref:Uncharacterized protein n=1 Tax=Varanus komodoensis TaxID=61221 RepID=A0A8D2J0B9_VARKO
ISASETPKSKLETKSFPPVSTPAPGPKPLSNRSCCHFSGSCLGCKKIIKLESARPSISKELPHPLHTFGISVKPRGAPQFVLVLQNTYSPTKPTHTGNRNLLPRTEQRPTELLRVAEIPFDTTQRTRRP